MSHDELCPCSAEPWKEDGYIDPEFGNVVYMPCYCSVINAVAARERTLTANRMLPILARLVAKAQISKNDARDVAAAVRGGDS